MNDLLMKLDRLKKAYDPISSLRGAGKDLEDAMAAYQRSSAGRKFMTDDENIMKAALIAQTFRKPINNVHQWDEDIWADWSGFDLGNVAKSRGAIQKLRQEMTRYQNLKLASEAMLTTLRVLRVSDNMDLKSFATKWCPSLTIMKEIDRQSVIVQYQGLVRASGEIVNRQNTVIRRFQQLVH